MLQKTDLAPQFWNLIPFSIKENVIFADACHFYVFKIFLWYWCNFPATVPANIWRFPNLIIFGKFKGEAVKDIPAVRTIVQGMSVTAFQRVAFMEKIECLFQNFATAYKVFKKWFATVMKTGDGKSSIGTEHTGSVGYFIFFATDWTLQIIGYTAHMSFSW